VEKITRTLLGMGAVLLATAGWALAAGDVRVTYTPDNTVFSNPERGFLYASEVHSWNALEQEYVLLDRNILQGYRQNENITLIKRSFYLEGFVNSAIPQWYLDKMQLDFNTLRATGLKAIIRFAYTNRSFVPPYGDADKAHVLEHLAQLQPIFQNNVDVIDVVEAGFIGNWGEWFYTDYFVADPNNPGSVTPADYEDRRQVLEGILNVLPPSRMAQLRTPFYKYKVYGTLDGSPLLPVPLNASNAHDGSYIARTGHHNDCFLGNETDAGTYGVWVNVADDKSYVAAETNYVPMGGEVCEPGLGHPRFDCQSAMNEMAQFHWSYLNVETGNSSRAIYDSWNTAGCLPEIKRRLGYRLALVQGTYPEKVASGGAFSIAIQLKNDGWSSPINPRLVNLVLRKKETGEIRTLPLTGEDPRFWLAGTTQTIAHTLIANVPPGKYDLLLHLADAEPALSTRPEYAIRLANSRVWEQATGYNSLRYTLTVTQAPPTKAATTTTVVSSKNPSTYRTSVTFTASVKSTTTGTPTGQVTFKDGSTTLGTGTLSGGKATFRTSSLPVGTHSITAVYGGSTSYNGSTSSALTQKVKR
jgi:hypothetical protein